jgi:hypothetical protein
VQKKIKLSTMILWKKFGLISEQSSWRSGWRYANFTDYICSEMCSYRAPKKSQDSISLHFSSTISAFMLFLELWGLYFMSFCSFFFSLVSKWVNCYVGYAGIAKPSTFRNKAFHSGCSFSVVHPILIIVTICLMSLFFQITHSYKPLFPFLFSLKFERCIWVVSNWT